MSAAIWLLLLVPFLLGLAVQGLVRSAFRRYSTVANHSGVTGAEAARALLDAHGLQRVGIEIIPGFLSDHYDGQAKALRLSEPVGRERSVSALGIAGHEVSHAYQDAEGSRTYRSRQSIGEQLARFAPWSTFFLIAGFWFGVPLFIVLSLLFVGWTRAVRARDAPGRDRRKPSRVGPTATDRARGCNASSARSGRCYGPRR